MIYILALIYILYTLSDACGDVAIEKGKQKQWHFWGAVQVGLFVLLLSYIYYDITWSIIIAFIVLCIIRFILFNVFHNLAKGNKWYYIGTTAWIDIQIRKLFPWIRFNK